MLSPSSEQQLHESLNHSTDSGLSVWKSMEWKNSLLNVSEIRDRYGNVRKELFQG